MLLLTNPPSCEERHPLLRVSPLDWITRRFAPQEGQRGLWPHFAISITLLLAAAAIILLAATPLSDLLVYDRTALHSGQWHRLLTCHLTHWSLDHLLWDVLVFVALALPCATRMPVRTLLCLAASAITIPVAVYMFLPTMQTYRGLSGLDSALFGLLAATLLRDKFLARQWLHSAAISALFLGFAAKLGIEVATAQAIFVNSDAFVPVPLAHLVGAATGMITACWPARSRQPAPEGRKNASFAPPGLLIY